jgi:hypothetical protein
MSVVQMLIANIQSLSDVDRSTVLTAFQQTTATVIENKVKKTHANKGKPTCYSDFVRMLSESHKDEITAYKAAHPEVKQGATLSWCGIYKKEHVDEYAEFEKAWNQANPKPEVIKPVAVDGSDKPKRVISDAQKAALKAGREAAKAKRASVTIELPTTQEILTETPAVTEPAAADASEKKGRKKDSERYTPEELVAVKAERAAKKAAKKAGKAAGGEDSGNISDSSNSTKSKID